MKIKDKNEHTGAIAWMAGNSVAANLLMLFLLVGGFIIMKNIKQEVFPEFTPESVRISVQYPGSSPDEVEKAVILPIEEAVQGLDGVEEVRSSAREGGGSVTVEAIAGADVQKLANDVQSEVDRITTFPDEIEKPEVRAASRRRDVLDLFIYGNVSKKVLKELGERVRDQLLEHPKVTQVELTGIPDLEISIEVSQENLRRYNLTLSEISRRIRQRSVDLPGGEIETRSGDVLVRMKERKDYGKEFRKIPIITTEEGAVVTLGQIAKITDGFEETKAYSLFNGYPTAQLEVYRIGKQTPVEVADGIRERLAEIKSTFPPGIKTAIMWDSSQRYRQRADLMIKNGYMGLILVLFLMGLFLEVRLAFWVMMGIPISFLGAFYLLPLMGVSINMVSMFAFIIALGIVVDDAIIVGENIYSYRQEGYSAYEASVKGASEVALPVTFAIMTNIVAFLPLYYIPGRMGKIFSVIPVVVGAAFLVSLIECLFILPAHLNHKGKRRWFPSWLFGWQRKFSHAFIRGVRKYYGAFLDIVLQYKYVVFATALGILSLTFAYTMSGRMGMSLFPRTPSNDVDVEVVFPFGTSVKTTEKAVKELAQTAKEIWRETGSEELVEGIMIRVGRGGSHKGMVGVELGPPEVRNKVLGTFEYARKWKERTGKIPGAEYVKFDMAGGGPGRGDPINIELRHGSMKTLRQASEILADRLREYPMVSEVNDGFQQGKPQFDLKMKDEGKALGLTAEEVGRQLRNAFYGARAIRQLRGRNEVDVMVKLPSDQRNSLYHLEEFMIRTPSGKFVPLQEVAEARLGRAFVTIERRNGNRIIQVTGDCNPRGQAGYVLNDLSADFLPELVQKFPGLKYSFEGNRADMRESLNSLKISFIIAMLTIFAMLAIPLRSYSQPLVVLVSVPFGVVGAVLGHMILGYSLSVVSLLGLVALSGVVINDSLILVSFANEIRKKGEKDHYQAIREASIRRFRPVLLTSLTTFGGLAPLMLETSRQARFLVPMAISLGFGIIFALFITLALVPSLYLSLEQIKDFLGISSERETSDMEGESSLPATSQEAAE